MNAYNEGKTLVILTHAYPYAPPSEQFLHAELKELSKAFDKIVVFPLSRSARVREKNDLEYDNVFIERTRDRSLAATAVKLIFSKGFLRESLRLSRHRNFSWQAWKTLLLTGYARVAYAEKVLRVLKSKYLSDAGSIVFYSYWYSHYANVACVLKRKVNDETKDKARAVARAHGSYDLFLTERTRGYRPFLPELNTQLDAVFSISEMGAAYLAHNGSRPCNIRVSRLGVGPAGRRIEEPAARPLVVSCSSVIPLKRIELIIAALETVSITGLRWLHIGGGPLLGEMKRLAAEKLEGKVDFRFLGAMKNGDIVPLYLSESPFVFINLSSVEGIPVSIMEACSCGIPIIATDVGGTKEICLDENNGMLLGPDPSIEEIAQAINRMQKNLGREWQRMSRNSLSVYAEKYDAGKNFEAFAQDLSAI